ncbi:Ldh family oxidoreductase [Shimia sediminis]|uniref:Ldh family oxidoreductase n=1 Tax=Shimia sediminis TaxID=2497945 RepID=UPI000F8F4015|nr:Ldh family oxidoreductase [Shimia sediminis]
MANPSKYSADTQRVSVHPDEAYRVITGVMAHYGCDAEVCEAVAEHLLDSEFSGVESHGVWRIHQYAKYYETGYLRADTPARLYQNDKGAWLVDGGGGIGIPAMTLALNNVLDRAGDAGIAAIALHDVGHTGRLGRFAEQAAEQGKLLIVIGGGGRKAWRLVAPYGGAKALMSTNPYAIGMPGGDHGPVVMDFATSAAAAGWIYGAEIAGATLPDGVLIDKDGAPTNDPADYFKGGAILTAGGPKGYAMAVAAEMIAEAMLGPVVTECNWLMIALDCTLYRDASAMQITAEEILAELRECPPAKGFDRVEVPGERERNARLRNRGKPFELPSRTWAEILEIAETAGVA